MTGETGRLAEMLSDPAFRKSFAANPDAAMQGQGLDRSKIPQPLLNTLFDLSHEELRALITTRDALSEAGGTPELAMKIV